MKRQSFLIFTDVNKNRGKVTKDINEDEMLINNNNNKNQTLKL